MANDELKETIRFRLAGALKKRVERLIARMGAGESKSALIRRALVEYLKREEAKLEEEDKNPVECVENPRTNNNTTPLP